MPEVRAKTAIYAIKNFFVFKAFSNQQVYPFAKVIHKPSDAKVARQASESPSFFELRDSSNLNNIKKHK